MTTFELLQESVTTLTVNKLRTGLAVLGIVIGIGSVISLISLGQGSQKAIETQIQSLGSNLLTVIPGSVSSGGVRGGFGGATTLTLDDANAIRTQLADVVVGVSPEVSSRSQVTAGRNNSNTSVTGVVAEYATIRKITLSSGTFISVSDNDSQSLVAVLGPTVATTLFGEGVDVVGQQLRIGKQQFRVIGVTTAKGGSGPTNQDDAIYVPLSVAQKILFGRTYLSTIAVSVRDQAQMVLAQDRIGYLLLSRHKLTDPTAADFVIMSQNDILTAASSTTGTFTTLLSGIAGISLLVGGIGIMNIMLVTVTERTREIGLRKALGATRVDIVRQFLLEAVLLTAIGGILGTGLGIGISFILSQSLGITFSISMNSLILALGVSGAIGLLFGWYPAQKAARLQPIEALRYE